MLRVNVEALLFLDAAYNPVVPDLQVRDHLTVVELRNSEIKNDVGLYGKSVTFC